MLSGIPRLDAGFYPTPLRPMPRLEAHLGAKARLWIKHDDWVGPAFGGNKVRKLEYVLAAALADGATDIITTGGIGSNHCRATAGLCAAHGLRCHLVLNVPEKWDPQAPAQPGNLALDRLFGATIVPVADRASRVPTMERVAADLRDTGAKPVVVPLGASFPLGALGFVRAAFELADQVRAQNIDPVAVYHSSSSGGTQSGLVVGARLAGLDHTRIIGVSADETATDLTELVAKCAAGTRRLLGAPASTREAIHVDDTQVGGGYGVPTPASTEAIRLLARLEGVVLDPVYSAKAMAGFLRDAPTATGDLVFWHTGGAPALFRGGPEMPAEIS